MPKQIRIARLVLFVQCDPVPLLGLAQLAVTRAAREALSPHSGTGSWMAPVVDDARRVADAQAFSAQYAHVGAALARLAAGSTLIALLVHHDSSAWSARRR
ncbi:hypothetical protein AB0469_37160 [Streptomyces sp. NPDC093801]|uniref:hypothetical protein n=1 Tax=Streptomyces sp. NPDC093801 TaxID=3155203 RepID=UPI00344E7D84